MEQTKNIKDIDYTTVFVKKAMADEIKNNYLHFGWKVETEIENKQYEDIVDITCSRPHNIENKDDLQILQVYTESTFNNLAKLEKNKHAKSTSIAFSLVLGGFIMLVCGLLGIFDIIKNSALWFDITFSAIGFVLAIVGICLLPPVLKKEKTDFEIERKKLYTELEELHKVVDGLSGGKNGK